MLKEQILKKKKIILVAFLGMVLLVGAVIGIIALKNRTWVTSTTPVYDSLDEDAGNLAGDGWTARY